jgi:hypothetical protein
VPAGIPPKNEHRIRELPAVTEAEMDDELKKSWEQLEEGLMKAMGRLSEAIEKAKAEMPDAMKGINDEYLRVQEMLDKAVDKLRKQ